MFKINELLEATGGKLILKRKDRAPGAVSIDSRTVRQGDVFIAIKGKNFDGHDYVKEAVKKGANTLIIMRHLPGVGSSSNANIILVNDTVRALGDIAHSYRSKFQTPVIAVTGSNGKTSTKELVAWLLESKYKVLKSPGTQNNQIGLPMTLLKLNKGHGMAVLEIGTNHFGEVDYLTKIARPNIGIITNIGPSHLEFLNSFNDVYREKYYVIKNLISPFIGILNMDDEFLRGSAKTRTDENFIVGFGVRNRSDLRASAIKRGHDYVEFLVNSKYQMRLNTVGAYNVYNALAAISAARLFGIEYEKIAARLAEFSFPEGRLTLRVMSDTNFLDDTYNSNPASLEKALEALRTFKARGRKIFIMGDMLELGSYAESFHRKAGKTVAQICDVFITVGSFTRLTAEAARKAGMRASSIFACSSSKEARDVLIRKLKPSKDDMVLVKGSRMMQMEQIILNR
ncbi:MAG: UDP-N-acetylmuramoyl-tripeptide--D-alanyl-D-alanine ligase [Candidatus Omnitrophica bacterium]|nr:UDP-N-acetylmuramoyl-tripeptide--D-alanyl-D-alanine ligase [Candidatus Omnitrophota bacterium]